MMIITGFARVLIVFNSLYAAFSELEKRWNESQKR